MNYQQCKQRLQEIHHCEFNFLPVPPGLTERQIYQDVFESSHGHDSPDERELPKMDWSRYKY